MLAVASVSFSFAVPLLSARVKNQAHDLVGPVFEGHLPIGDFGSFALYSQGSVKGLSFTYPVGCHELPLVAE